MSSHLPSDRIRWGICLAVLALLLSFSLVAVASATPPPPEYRAQLAAPNLEYLNASDSGLFIKVDEYNSEQGLAKRPPSLPNVSDNYYYTTFTSPGTDEQYLDAVWYFNTWDGLTKGKDELHRYLQQHGTVTPIALNLSPELAGSSSPDIRELALLEQWQAINATRYDGDGTSGYFITFATNYYPGENYYITYYGIMGKADRSEETTHRLHLLAMTTIPRFISSFWFDYLDPATPMKVPLPSPIPMSWISLLMIGGLFLFLIIGFVFIPALVLAYITVGLSRWIEARSAPWIHSLLPPLVAVCLIVVPAGIVPFVDQVSAGVIEGIVLAALISMGVMTPWPLFLERLKVVKPQTAVFICGIGTFFVLTLGIMPWTQLSPDLGGFLIALAQPFPSAAVRSVIFYLESVVIAIVLYAMILFWDRVRRRRQSKKHPVEDEDQ
ncbi:AI-2E family transporter [Methanosphaerula palustris]|uniref:Uncharacterized protein n=1 Tax=Methanosphaerula palustris (strain ATCC BAA-1556 / DSM 19958 / E1-9c) TaxID=521011 RepID=B8GJB7_METPE|nr:hypothetical protein [Methanosphaerula palustris]ACL16958.1 hypothetical protein Mpal_1646 [Methanosphaerula palustris E1-9c]